MFESHHISRHFENRCRQTRKKARKKARQAAVNQRALGYRQQSQTIQRLPKLSLAVHAASHLILAAQASTGTGADHAHFPPLLQQAATRRSLTVVLADAGYDSEANHQLARGKMNIRSLIPATIGPRTTKLPAGHYRRLMRRRLRSGPDKRLYGQRWQVETVNSMIKRNLGSACRARSTWGRKKDMLLRVITHNLMIVANLEG
jgi:hypothetical protein